MRQKLVLLMLHLALAIGCGGTVPQDSLPAGGPVLDICQYQGEWLWAERLDRSHQRPEYRMRTPADFSLPSKKRIPAASLRSDGDNLFVAIHRAPLENCVQTYSSLERVRESSPDDIHQLKGDGLGTFGVLHVVDSGTWVLAQRTYMSFGGPMYRSPAWEATSIPLLDSMLTRFADAFPKTNCYSLACAASPSACFFASITTSSKDGNGVLYVDQNQEEFLLTGLEEAPQLCMSPDGLKCAALMSTEVVLFNCQTLKTGWSHDVVLPEDFHSYNEPRRLDFAPDGSVLAVTTIDDLVVLDCRSGDVCDQISLKSATAVAFSTDQSQLAVGSWSKADGFRVLIYDWDSSQRKFAPGD